MKRKELTEKELAEEKKALEEIIELSSEKPRKKIKKKLHKQAKKSDYFFAILVNGVLLYLFNNYAKSNFVDFLNAHFALSLPIVNLSLCITILGNILFFFNDEEKFKSAILVFIDLLSMLVIFSLYKNFPFDFSGVSFLKMELFVRIALLVGMIVTGVSAIIELFKIIFNTFDWK